MKEKMKRIEEYTKAMRELLDRLLDIYKYRDSGDNMITGLIKIL